MIIKEIIERECCQLGDLKPVAGTPRIGANAEYRFCVHYGTYSAYRFYNDGVDSNSRMYMKTPPLWEKK